MLTERLAEESPVRVLVDDEQIAQRELLPAELAVETGTRMRGVDVGPVPMHVEVGVFAVEHRAEAAVLRTLDVVDRPDALRQIAAHDRLDVRAHSELHTQSEELDRVAVAVRQPAHRARRFGGGGTTAQEEVVLAVTVESVKTRELEVGLVFLVILVVGVHPVDGQDAEKDRRQEKQRPTHSVLLGLGSGRVRT